MERGQDKTHNRRGYAQRESQRKGTETEVGTIEKITDEAPPKELKRWSEILFDPGTPENTVR